MILSKQWSLQQTQGASQTTRANSYHVATAAGVIWVDGIKELAVALYPISPWMIIDALLRVCIATKTTPYPSD